MRHIYQFKSQCQILFTNNNSNLITVVFSFVLWIWLFMWVVSVSWCTKNGNTGSLLIICESNQYNSQVTEYNCFSQMKQGLFLISKSAKNGLVFSWRPVLRGSLGRIYSDGHVAMTFGTSRGYDTNKAAFDASLILRTHSSIFLSSLYLCSWGLESDFGGWWRCRLRTRGRKIGVERILRDC